MSKNVLANQVDGFIEKSSFIRKMFENGIELKKKFGAENVYDFSLGNPDLPPPTSLVKNLHEIADELSEPFSLGYMPNAGYQHVRDVVATKVSEEQGVETPANNVVISCGAAGGMNAFFRATLNTEDEVVVPAPYFVEYNFYVSNFGGKLIPVKSKDMTFELDFEAITKSITPKTRAMIINSPNNPTGQVYTAEEIKQLAELLEAKSAEFGNTIYLVSDEPYRFLYYGEGKLPSVFDYYKNSVVISSYSKSLSMAGARIGYVAVNPAMEESELLLQGIILTNRILGFVNAPAIAQKLLAKSLDNQVDVAIYSERCKAMRNILVEAGFEFNEPKGAFYFFVKSPIADDVEFCAELMKENILAVPGSGFGFSGYIRLTFCVGKDVIERSREAFLKVMGKYN
ncbi:pyridoxal phosphate-dependent aminotransferase [Lentisphaerota bacterium WC36G]|nr:pyridoxal phosphate-dependent aminotransferase [Lentisphaerae bacterium WC36]